METTIAKVYNDLLLAADNGQVSALCLLDLTAAFDTADYELFWLRLERQFGLRGTVMQWGVQVLYVGQIISGTKRWFDFVSCAHIVLSTTKIRYDK